MLNVRQNELKANLYPTQFWVFKRGLAKQYLKHILNKLLLLIQEIGWI